MTVRTRSPPTTELAPRKQRRVRAAQAVSYPYPYRSTAPALGVRFAALRDTRPFMPCSGRGDRSLVHRTPPLSRLLPESAEKNQTPNPFVSSPASCPLPPPTLPLLVAACVGEARCKVVRQHEPKWLRLAVRFMRGHLLCQHARGRRLEGDTWASPRERCCSCRSGWKT